MSNRWWRAYDEAVNDPKLQLISDSLFRAWFNVMCIASSNDGVLPDNATMAFTLRAKPEKVAQILTQLHTAGLLDKTETGFTPHNWNGRQYKTDTADVTNAERQKRFRKGKRDELNQLKALRDTWSNGPLRNGVTNVTAKRPDTDTDIKTTAPLVETREGPGNGSGSKTGIPVTSELVASIQRRIPH